MTDSNPVLDALLTRRSIKPKRLEAPAPGLDVLARCAQSALRAPNCGNLAVCRFLLIKEQAREQLSGLFREAALRRGADAEKADRHAGKAKKGPMLVGFVTRRFDGADASAEEQLITAGAALENFLLALGSCGFGAIVLSESCRDDPQFKAALGIREDEALSGWITIGTPAAGTQHEPEDRPAPLAAWPS